MPTGDCKNLNILLSSLDQNSQKNPGSGRVKYRRGQELLEFALVFPLILLFILGVVDVGRMFYTSVVVQRSA